MLASTRALFQRFRRNSPSYAALWILLLMVLFSLFAELFINNRALMVRYEGRYYFPTYGGMIPGKAYGLDYDYEVDYRALKRKWSQTESTNWLILPIVPYNAYESDVAVREYPPSPPSFARRHFLGTDTTGRDVLARLVYGFRTIISLSFFYCLGVYIVGVFVGSWIGYLGGLPDLIGQRLIEIGANIPFLYIVIIASSLVKPTISLLLILLILFSWTGITYYFRSATYKEKSRDYVTAARLLGASTGRILFVHILPNTVTILITFLPFTLAGAMTALTALDFLGFGLPAPTPSWGQLLREGTQAFSAPWIVFSSTLALVSVLMLTTLIGEGLRQAVDPKSWITYD